MSEQEDLLAQDLRRRGVDVEQVRDILGHDEQPTEPTRPLVIPRLEGYEFDFPEPGIYFDMPEEVYHAIPALSSHGIKRMAASPMIYWSKCDWMNPEWPELKAELEEKQKGDHHLIGHAYHCRVLESAEAYAQRYAIALDPKGHPKALVTMDDIRNAYPEGVKPKGASKRICFDYLKEFDATVELWDDLLAAHAEGHKGKEMIPARAHRQIQLAAAMIERDPGIGPLIAGGYGEVSLFWYCPRTGVPKKARIDKLKVKRMIDLKTIANQKERSIENAIRDAISSYKYAIQPAHYLEGAEEVRKIVRVRSASAIFASDDEQIAYAMKWASNRTPDEWWWIFQQKGLAPITRAVEFNRALPEYMIAKDICSNQSRRFRECCEAYGLDPWLDIKEPYTLFEGDLYQSATEI